MWVGIRLFPLRRVVAGFVMAVAVLGLLDLSSVARAQTSPAPVADDGAAGVQRVAILQLGFSGEVPDASQDLFLSRLVEGLAMARFQVLSGAAVGNRLRERSPKLVNCSDSDCYPTVAEVLEVGFLVTGRVEEANKSYDISVQMINGRTGATVGQSHERCETCGITEAAEKMSLATSALRTRLEALASHPARIVIRSSPAGAAVNIDGKLVGTTPAGTEIPGGLHRLVLSLEKYEPLERTFTAVSGVDETLQFELLRSPSTVPLTVLGWVGIVAGVALVGGGVYAAIVDGQAIDCGPDDRDVDGNCPRVRDTDALAATLVGLGAVTTTLGGVFLWVASEQAPASHALAPAQQAGHRLGLGLRGRF